MSQESFPEQASLKELQNQGRTDISRQGVDLIFVSRTKIFNSLEIKQDQGQIGVAVMVLNYALFLIVGGYPGFIKKEWARSSFAL